MFKKIINWFHVVLLMKFYLLIKKDKSVWLSYNDKDLLKKIGIISKLIKFSEKNPKILDLGCGNGIMLKYFLPISKELYGVDLSLSNILNAQKNLKLVPKNNLVKINLLKYLESNKQKFDLIIIHGVIGYFEIHQQIEIIKLSLTSLEENGYLFLGGIQFKGDNYVWQTYPMTNGIIDFINSLEPKIYNEHELYDIKKYSKNQRTILLKKSNYDNQ